jgi:predicted phosphoadenosine phosphosulfate sulfurtransferase
MPTQTYLKGKNVLDAARERIAFIFDAFETIQVSISGGKDSTVLAHLAMEEARRRDRKIGLFFLDEEVVYQSTVEQIEYLMTLAPKHTNRLWLQVPFRLTNATSLHESQLIAWEPGKHKLWMHPKGKGNIVAPPWDRARETVRNKDKGFGFYDVLDNFERCYSGAAFLVGLRGIESPNRWRTMIQHPVTVQGERVYWGTRNGANVNLYPLYDWGFHDVWRYIHDHGLKYSRISSLIHEKAFKSLCDLPEFEPKTYERLCKRIKGIAFAQETGKSAKSLKVRALPKNFKSWRTYRDFLLDTYPDADKKPIFVRRFARQLDNEHVARQQCRQLILNDYENNLPIDNKPDPRLEVVRYYMEHL